MDVTFYKSLAENLLYLTAKRPDIILNSPSHFHLEVAKKVFRYISDTIEYVIRFNRVSQLKLIGFYDSDWDGCVDDMRSTSNYFFLLIQVCFLGVKKGNNQWHNHLLKLNMLQLVQLLDVGEKQEEPTTLFCENKSAIIFIVEPNTLQLNIISFLKQLRKERLI